MGKFISDERSRQQVGIHREGLELRNEQPVDMKTPNRNAVPPAPDRWYVLFIMTAVYTLNIADRYVVSTLIEPIKAEFRLSDGAIGFLTGSALAIFYVTAGIPLGALADRTNRQRMIALALALWSAVTVVCGLAQTFWQLLFARIWVGIGEAGGTPPSQSLLSDKFSAHIRPSAMTVYALGCAFGATLGSSGGGWLSDHHGWRRALLVFGAAGLPLALLVWRTVREPKRGAADAHPMDTGHVAIRQVVRFVWTQKSLVHVLIGGMILTFWGWGLIWWTPAFLVRSHHLTVGQAGSLLGPMYGYGGTAVTLLTAWVMHYAVKSDSRRQLWIIAVSTLVGVIPSVVTYAAKTQAVATLALWIFVPITYLYIGPTLALVQNLVPAAMRALACAILLFLDNVANLLLAPQLIGLASDEVAKWIPNPQESLRWVLIAGSSTGVWAAVHFILAARDLRRDLVRVSSAEPLGSEYAD